MTTAETHPGRFEQMTALMVSVGAALRSLVLADLPPIASVHVTNDYMRGLRADLQLSVVTETATGLGAWAGVLTSPTVTARHCGEFLRVEVTGHLGGERVVVWDLVRGAEGMSRMTTAFALPADPDRDHVIPLDALRAYAAHEGGEH